MMSVSILSRQPLSRVFKALAQTMESILGSRSSLREGASWTEERLKDYLSTLEGLPIDVTNWEVEFRLDASYEPAIYVYPEVEIKNMDDKNEYERLFDMYFIVRRELQDKVDSNKFIYVNAHFTKK